MPNSLIKLLNWVTNDKAFNADDNPPEMQIDGLKKCLELIECIVAISRIMFLRVVSSIYNDLSLPRLMHSVHTDSSSTNLN
jgi:hypothetical protein